MHVTFPGIFKSLSVPKIDSNMDTVKRNARHICTYSFARDDLTLSTLVDLSSHVVGHVLKDFNDRFGDILVLLKTTANPYALQTLLQFFDQELRCFTFQDYRLAPTLEEYSHFLKHQG